MLYSTPAPSSFHNANDTSFDFESPSLYTPGHTFGYEAFHSGLPADPNCWTSSYASPSSIPGERSTPFPDPWSCNATEDCDAPWRGIACVDPLASGLDAVNVAFLLLIEAYKCGSDPEIVALLRPLLCNSRLPREVLLGVVDWSRLLELAAISSSRVLCGAASREPPPAPSRDAKLEHSLNWLPLNGTTAHSDLQGADCSVELLSLADTRPRVAISDYESEGWRPLSPFSNGSAAPAFQSDALNISSLSSIVPASPPTFSASLPTPPPIHPFNPSLAEPLPKATSNSPEPSLNVEHQRSASRTPSPTAPRRQCMDCAVEHTTQWRTHPQLSGYLCNACGQHQAKHKSRRSPLAIRRERARANDKCAPTVPIHPSSPPEKRGGEVIMRVPLG
ncbi:hypothetical protein B0H14DRAFT_3457397 [Mycena olivaceomarginata]|nr:hypothetical protein B0H14DRAFT_3457397 [Mycena olivaceomarginata]